MSIDRATAARVAKLARIKVEESSLDSLASEFNQILGFIEQLNEVNVEGIEPMTSVSPQKLASANNSRRRSPALSFTQALRPSSDVVFKYEISLNKRLSSLTDQWLQCPAK